METIHVYADGGNAGKNPSPKVYWSVYAIDRVVLRETSEEYHTNNDAEWCALLAALTYARDHHPFDEVVVRMDSALIVNQFNRRRRIKIERHYRLAGKCWHVAAQLLKVTVEWVPRRQLVIRLGH